MNPTLVNLSCFDREVDIILVAAVTYLVYVIELMVQITVINFAVMILRSELENTSVILFRTFDDQGECRNLILLFGNERPLNMNIVISDLKVLS